MGGVRLYYSVREVVLFSKGDCIIQTGWYPLGNDVSWLDLKLEHSESSAFFWEGRIRGEREERGRMQYGITVS